MNIFLLGLCNSVATGALRHAWYKKKRISNPNKQENLNDVWTEIVSFTKQYKSISDFYKPPALSVMHTATNNWSTNA